MWRDDKPTQAQLTAISNISTKFDIPSKKVSNKGEAADEIGRLIELAKKKKAASSYGSYEEGDEEDDVWGDLANDFMWGDS